MLANFQFGKIFKLHSKMKKKLRHQDEQNSASDKDNALTFG